MTATPTTDQTRVEALVERLIGALDDASLALQCSIAHQVGLFDVMAGLPPATSDEIAREAGLVERYVREWLGAVTTGGIVEYDPTKATYHLPPEHAAVLTRAAGADNLARTFQYIPLLAQVEGRIVEAFRSGGGVPYSEYESFHRVMADDSSATFDDSLLDMVIPLVEGLPEQLAAGIDMADIGCGRGHAVNLLAREYPASRFVGYDFSPEAIAAGCAEAESMGLENARFELLDVATLDVLGVFDLVTAFDAIHDQARPTEVLRRIERALRPGGVFLMVDIKASSLLEANREIPWATFLYTLSTMHCLAVSLAQDGEGLGTVWGRQRALGMLDDAGFAGVEVRHIDADPFNSYFIATKSRMPKPSQS